VDETQTAFKPPYMSFQTFLTFVEELASRPLPPQIDRSMMGSKSGTDQNNLTSALKGFGLINSDHRVEPALVQLATSDETKRNEKLAELVRAYYPDPITVSEQNGTEGQLIESFKRSFSLDTVETRRKAITFFLHAARVAGIPLSPHFPQTRTGSGSPGTPRPKRSAKRKTAPPVNGAGASNSTATRPNQPGGDTYSVSLQSGGSVSVVVSVNLFALSTEDRNFVIDLVDKLKGYPRSPDAVDEAPAASA
jgi:hypothetical protein